MRLRIQVIGANMLRGCVIYGGAIITALLHQETYVEASLACRIKAWPFYPMQMPGVANSWGQAMRNAAKSAMCCGNIAGCRFGYSPLELFGIRGENGAIHMMVEAEKEF